ncbi:MAG: DNA repair protein RecN [Armatimonadota bacterium]|nr:DNA repair protein RecN [Armatimonadota bacterium]MDR7550311.1 DNA repair protein RecN [Armatimonadota bacterium]
MRLAELRLRDFAGIDAAVIAFRPGLNAVSGEVGTTRSVIRDALAVATGVRTTTDFTRGRGATARVEARFDVDPEGAAGRWLREQGVGGRDLVVAREVAPGGPGQGWINDRPVPAETLADLGTLLVEILGEPESRLLQPATHLDLLDAFAGPAVQELRAAVAEQVLKRAELRARLQAMVAGERERTRQLDLLAHQIWEIDAARLQPGEDQELLQRRTRLANAERLLQAAAAAYAALSEADGQAAADQLGRALDALRASVDLDPVLAKAAERLEAMARAVGEIAQELLQYAQTVDVDPSELVLLDDRLAAIRSLHRKYGPTADAILAYRAEAAAMRGRLRAATAPVAQLGEAIRELERDLGQRLERLGALRREAARALEHEVERTLQALDMSGPALVVAVAHDPDENGVPLAGRRVSVSPAGADRVEFFLAPAPGQTPRSLAAAAADWLPLMLVLRVMLPDPGAMPVLVCAGVDAGLDGPRAGSLARFLVAASRSRQVLCLTDSTEVTGLADRHIRVTKEQAWGRLRIQVQTLDRQQARVAV